MPLLFQPALAIFLCISHVTSRKIRDRSAEGYNPPNLELPLNLTDLVPLLNHTYPKNDTRVAAASSSSDDYIAWSDTAASPFSTLPPYNVSLTSLHVSAPSIGCSAEAFGKDLNVNSCLEALSMMSTSEKPVTYGERDQGTWNINLPLRILSTDGKCAIDIGHDRNIWSDEASPFALREAAKVLLKLCVQTEPNEGGIATNIGKNGHLYVRVMPYTPSVYCGGYGIGPDIDECKSILDSMSVDGTKQVFGQENDTDPSIRVRLPFKITGRQNKCQIYIDTLVPGSGQDVTEFYEVWEAATAIESMCVQTGQSGYALRLGNQKKLIAIMRDPTEPLEDSLTVS